MDHISDNANMTSFVTAKKMPVTNAFLSNENLHHELPKFPYGRYMRPMIAL